MRDQKDIIDPIPDFCPSQTPTSFSVRVVRVCSSEDNASLILVSFFISLFMASVQILYGHQFCDMAFVSNDLALFNLVILSNFIWSLAVAANKTYWPNPRHLTYSNFTLK